MAINILTEPQNPPIAGDYTLDQAIQHAAEVPQLSILTGWETTAAAPAAKQGAFIRHAGNTFQVQGSDESISGSPASGINYIRATEAAGVITLAWVTSTTGYAYNAAYGGIYNGSGQQLLRDVCYLDGALYIRGVCQGMDFNSYVLANGGYSVGDDLTVTGSIITTGELSTGTVSVSTSTPFIIPAGIYDIYGSDSFNSFIEYYINGSWREAAAIGNPVQVVSNGVAYRANSRSGSYTLYWNRH